MDKQTNTLVNDESLWTDFNSGDVDALTGFVSREYMKKHLAKVIEQQQQGQFWIVSIDDIGKVQQYKGVLFCDEVICDIARILSVVFNDSSLIGRYKENFLIYTKDILPKEEIHVIADEVNYKVSTMYKMDCIDCQVTASIGVADIPSEEISVKDVLEQVGKAVSYVRDFGGNDYQVYDELCANQDNYSGGVLKLHEEELFELMPKGSVTEYTFHLLCESKDAESAVGFVLKRAVEYYMIDHCALYVAEYDECNMRCKGEARRTMDVELNKHVVGYSSKGWDHMVDKVSREETCCVYSRSDEDKEKLSEVFARLPEDATIMDVKLRVSGNYVGDLLLIDYSGRKLWTEEEKRSLEDFTQVLAYHYLKRKAEKKDQAENKQEAGRDAITGVYNFETFLRIAEEIIKDAPEKYALTYLDIGNFKAINRACGYDMGDYVLQKCARIMEKLPSVECVGRVYGDKFAVLAKRVVEDSMEKVKKDSYNINCRIREELRKICNDESIMIHTGLYCFAPGDKMDTAISKAKVAKNIAKQRWTSKMIVYEEWMSDSTEKSYDIMSKVDEAIAEREFLVYLQPKVNSKTQEIIGAEALVRWKKKDGTMVFPDEFIPVFERNGKIIDVDYYVYEEVFRYLRKRFDNNLPVVPISMNVSRVHLQDEKIIDKIAELMEKYQIPCKCLEFEITEQVYVEKLQEALPFIEKLREQNIKISIDDFGSGYSSLNMISTIPLDVLKLDKAFMKRGQELTRKDKAVITHLVELAKDIELEVLCEGVETPVQAEFVKDIGCNAWQGYCFARPMPIEEFDEFLDSKQIQAVVYR